MQKVAEEEDGEGGGEEESHTIIIKSSETCSALNWASPYGTQG